MKNSYKLLEILATFNKSEIRQLRKLLRSPFFVMREDLKILFEFLVAQQNKKKRPPTLEAIFAKTYPAEKFNAIKIRGTMSDLLERVEEFLLINYHRQDQLEARLLLAQIYRKRKLEKSYQTNIKKTAQLLHENTNRNGHYYEQLLDFHLEKMTFQINTKRTDHLYFKEISDTTDVLFLIRKLQNACSQLTHKSVYKMTTDFGLLDYFLEQIEDQPQYMDIPAISILYYCYRFIKDTDLDYFQKFKTALFTNRHYFTNEDLQAPYRLAINFCIRKLNENDLFYAREGLTFYQEGIAAGILLENGLIPRFSFNNMVAMALQLQEYTWVENFITNSREQLAPKFKEQTVNFNFARLEFERQDYDRALVYLQSAEYDDLVSVLISKMLLIKIYFELNETEPLLSSLDSFQQFIRRREVSDYHRKNFLNIIHFIKKILAIPIFAKKERFLLINQIEKETILSERNWLLEKIR